MHDVSKLSTKACGTGQKINIDGVRLTLTAPDTHESHWIDYNDYLRQLQAAWLSLRKGSAASPCLNRADRFPFKIRRRKCC